MMQVQVIRWVHCHLGPLLSISASSCRRAFRQAPAKCARRHFTARIAVPSAFSDRIVGPRRFHLHDRPSFQGDCARLTPRASLGDGLAMKRARTYAPRRHSCAWRL